MTTLLNNTVTLAQVQLSQVIEHFKQDDSSLLQAYSEYASNNGYESVYDNDEDSINMMFTDSHDAIRAAFYGDYNPSDAYFTFNGYGNLQSFEYLVSDNSPIDLEGLSQWIIDNESYSDYDIEVTTLDDMLASIEDNITDDETMTYKLADYINESYDSDDVVSDVAQWCIVTLYDYDYNQLNDIITLLGIDYE